MNKIICLLIAFVVFQFDTFAQYTSIPDPNFEQELINNGTDTEGNLDSQILTTDALAFMGDLNIANKGISDLTGIEAFVNMTGINFNYNTGITSVDLSNCTSLTTVSGIGCDILASVNVTGLTDLTILDLRSGALTALDVSSNIALKNLNIRKNSIVSLDLSENLVIDVIDVKWNVLTFLDLRNGNNANIITFVGDYNWCLKCVFVDDTSDPNLDDHAYWIFDDLSTLVETEGECDAVPPIDPEYCPILSVGQESQVSFNMFPNPVEGTLYIKAKTGNTLVNIYRITGKKVLTRNLVQGDNLINVSDLVSGMYLAVFVSDNQMDTKKLIVK